MYYRYANRLWSRQCYLPNPLARIWSSLGTSRGRPGQYLDLIICVAKHRFDNLHGEQCARLDRDHRVREQLVEANTFLTRVASSLVFGFNKPISSEINGLYVDGIVYTMHWRDFMRRMNESWRDSRLMVRTMILIAQQVSNTRSCIS